MTSITWKGAIALQDEPSKDGIAAASMSTPGAGGLSQPDFAGSGNPPTESFTGQGRSSRRPWYVDPRDEDLRDLWRLWSWQNHLTAISSNDSATTKCRSCVRCLL